MEENSPVGTIVALIKVKGQEKEDNFLADCILPHSSSSSSSQSFQLSRHVINEYLLRTGKVFDREVEPSVRLTVRCHRNSRSSASTNRYQTKKKSRNHHQHHHHPDNKEKRRSAKKRAESAKNRIDADNNRFERDGHLEVVEGRRRKSPHRPHRHLHPLIFPTLRLKRAAKHLSEEVTNSRVDDGDRKSDLWRFSSSPFFSSSSSWSSSSSSSSSSVKINDNDVDIDYTNNYDVHGDSTAARQQQQQHRRLLPSGCPHRSVRNVKRKDVLDNVGGEEDDNYAEVTVDVVVVDVNDNRPMTSSDSYEADVDENLQPELTIFKMDAWDPDAGNNGLLSYSLELQSPVSKEGVTSELVSDSVNE